MAVVPDPRKGSSTVSDIGSLDAPLSQFHRERRGMRVPALLGNVPNIAYGVRLRSKAKPGLGNQVDDLVGGKEIAGVEIDSTIRVSTMMICRTGKPSTISLRSWRLAQLGHATCGCRISPRRRVRDSHHGRRGNVAAIECIHQRAGRPRGPGSRGSIRLSATCRRVRLSIRCRCCSSSCRGDSLRSGRWRRRASFP